MPYQNNQPLSREILSPRAKELVQSLEGQRGSRSLPAFEERVRLSREELLGQPKAIQQTLYEEAANIKSIAKKVINRGVERIYITGCGDSYFSAMAVRFAFERIVRKPSVAIQALEYTRYYHLPTDSKTLVIALSASGVVPRTVEALLKAKELGAMTIAVSNNFDTPLTNEAEYCIQVRAKRMGGCPTQASTGAIAALELLALEMGGLLGTLESSELKRLNDEILVLPTLVNGIIQQYDELAKRLAERLKDSPIYFYVGSGPGLATASFGAAKVKEMSQDHAVVLHLEEYHHYRSLKAGEPIFLVASGGLGGERILQTAQDAKKSNGILVALVDQNNQTINSLADITFSLPAISEELSVIPYVIPLQMFAIHLGSMKPPKDV